MVGESPGVLCRCMGVSKSRLQWYLKADCESLVNPTEHELYAVGNEPPQKFYKDGVAEIPWKDIAIAQPL